MVDNISNTEETFVLLCDDATNELNELPCERNNSLLLKNLQMLYPNATGLRYKNDASGAYRFCRCEDGVIYPPSEKEGSWHGKKFYPVLSKRSSSSSNYYDAAMECRDLIVLGINYLTVDATLLDHFSQFGELEFCSLKRTSDGKSRGFAFIRFKDFAAQMTCLKQRHLIDGRWCEVKVPIQKEEYRNHQSCRIFVGQLTKDISTTDLKQYFSQYGNVIDVYIPKTFRGFGFVTFDRMDPVTHLLYSTYHHHVIRGVEVNVTEATPRERNSQNTAAHAIANAVNFNAGYQQNQGLTAEALLAFAAHLSGGAGTTGLDSANGQGGSGPTGPPPNVPTNNSNQGGNSGGADNSSNSSAAAAAFINQMLAQQNNKVSMPSILYSAALSHINTQNGAMAAAPNTGGTHSVNAVSNSHHQFSSSAAGTPFLSHNNPKRW